MTLLEHKQLITITGPSGAGKTMLQDHVANKYNYTPIYSFTDRPQRDAKDIHHRYVEPGFFSQFKPEELICHDPVGDHEYGCLLTDFVDESVFVVEEKGLVEIFKRLSRNYDILSVYVNRPLELRRLSVDEGRIKRDLTRMLLPEKVYDLFIDNNSTDVSDLYKKFDDFFLKYFAF